METDMQDNKHGVNSKKQLETSDYWQETTS
jgi:hypothetical protein